LKESSEILRPRSRDVRLYRSCISRPRLSKSPSTTASRHTRRHVTGTMAEQQTAHAPRLETERVSDEEASHGEYRKESEPDGQRGHDEDVRWTFARVVAIISLCLVYIGMHQAADLSKSPPNKNPGAQEILYFTGGALTYIGVSINTNVPNWLLTANTLAVTATCPFVCSTTQSNAHLTPSRWDI
jgi:hypothetical protein